MAKAKTTTMKLDMMSVTVLLVMAIFGGIVGYYLGRGASTPQAVSLQSASMMMRDKGMTMQDTGKFMEDQGKKMGSQEMMNKGTQLMQDGSTLESQGNSMGGMMAGY